MSAPEPFQRCEDCGTITVDLDAHRSEAHDWRLEAKCEYCGAEFEPHARDVSYCSHACAVKDQQRGGQA